MDYMNKVEISIEISLQLNSLVFPTYILSIGIINDMILDESA